MKDKLLVFIYKEGKFSKYQIVNDSDTVRKTIDDFNKSNKPETAIIIDDEDVMQAIFQKESLETVKSYVENLRESIKVLREDFDRQFDNLDYSFNDFYGKVKDYLDKENE
jgi:hypothetical protein